MALQSNSGKITLGELRDVCLQFNLPIEPELLQALLKYCDIDKDGQINYVEFSNFLNWKDKMPEVTKTASTTNVNDKVQY